MKNHESPKVGQTVFVHDFRNKGVKPALVKKVGRKYFTVGAPGMRDREYFITSWDERSETSSGIQYTKLWESEQDYELESEKQRLREGLESFFRSGRIRELSIHALRSISQAVVLSAE